MQCALAAIKEALSLCQDRNLHQMTGSRVPRIPSRRRRLISNQKLKDLCWEKNIILSFSPAHQPSSKGIAERMVGILKSTVRRMLKQAHVDREWRSYAARFAGHMMREKVPGRQRQYPLFGQLVGIWKSHYKAQAKSLDDRGSVGYLLDIDIWQSGTTRIMQDGIVVKGLAPKLLGPCRYHINPQTDISKLEEGMPWRTIKDEFGSSNGSIMKVKCTKVVHMLSNLMLQRRQSSLQAWCMRRCILQCSTTSQMFHVLLMSKTVNVAKKLSLMRKFPVNVCRRRRIYLTKRRTSRSRPRASL